MFRQYVHKNGGKKCLMVLADSLKIYKDDDDKEGQILSSPEVFYNECGEDDCKFSGRSTRMDPIVKLYPSCPLMLTQNDNVRGGIANGTKCSFVEVTLFRGKENTFTTYVEGHPVRCVFASQVKSIKLNHSNKNNTTFELKPKKFSFKANYPMPPQFQSARHKKQPARMAAFQLPVISNSATTGHKLQGCTLDYLIVNSWSYASNWAYTVLSRVKTLRGLFLREKIDPDKDYSVDSRLAHMLREFRESKTPLPYDDRNQQT